jgi:thioredoxin-related protein
MKRTLLLLLAALALSPVLTANGEQPVSAPDGNGKTTAGADSTEIHWMTIQEAEAAMKKKPKKVWVDMYTGWCGWCKVMDKKTFSNPAVIRYINENFYAVKFDAETKQTIRFRGTDYGLSTDGRVNQLAAKLLNGQLSYPSSILISENWEHAYLFAGYLNVAQTEEVLRYFNEVNYKTVSWQQHEAGFRSSWKELAVADGGPAGH